jgi:hydroxymethylpyrimidine pyrophosphatase-like HAD family hydrolase
VSADLLGPAARRWAALERSDGQRRLILADIDGVVTRGEGQRLDLEVLAQLAAVNARAQSDPCVPALTLCTGRQAPYVELMAQATAAFLPCIFEHGAGLFFPEAFRYVFNRRLGNDYAARLAGLRARLEGPLLQSGRAFVQPGKEATMTLYPLGETSADAVVDIARHIVQADTEEFTVARNGLAIELRPPGIDKGDGARWIAEILTVSLSAMVGVGDGDLDLSYMQLTGFAAAPANASPAVVNAVDYVAGQPFGLGLLEIVTLVEHHNRSIASSL